jgi:hypothetical protein
MWLKTREKLSIKLCLISSSLVPNFVNFPNQVKFSARNSMGGFFLSVFNWSLSIKVSNKEFTFERLLFHINIVLLQIFLFFIKGINRYSH